MANVVIFESAHYEYSHQAALIYGRVYFIKPDNNMVKIVNKWANLTLNSLNWKK
jgi:hypothetical protein